MNETIHTHRSLRGLYLFMGLLLAAVLACTILSAVTLSLTLQGIREEEQARQTREDGVIIADEYPILSTRHIAEAHRSGNTSRLSDRDRQTLELGLAVLDAILTDGMSPFQQEKAVFDWMVDNLANDSGLLTVIPTTAQDAHEPHGVLRNRSGVCVGYATTFRFLMELLDIPCMVIHNEEAYHSWNLVQLDGAWYHVDIYGAIGSGSSYTFNLPDSLMSQSWDTDFFPAATGLSYNPAFQAAQPTDDVYHIPAWLREQLTAGAEMASLLFAPGTDEERLAVGEQLISQAIERASSSEQYGHLMLSHVWMPTDEGQLLVVYLMDSETEETLVDPEEQGRIEEAVDAAFGDLALSPDGGMPAENWDW